MSRRALYVVSDPGYNENRPYFNLGCASQRNLAAMIDNPADLEQPRSETPAYNARRDMAFERYRKGMPIATSNPDADKAKLERHRQMTRVHDEEATIRSTPRNTLRRFLASPCRPFARPSSARRVTAAGQDRRLAKAHLTAKDGGLAAAIEVYETMPTPNVIVIESDGTRDILEGLDDLAGVCDPGTRVVVIGNPNDTAPYRELVRRGVNDYVVGPVETLDVVRSICSLFSASETIITGRVIAVVGAKGGVGASTVAHNVAWTIARDLALIPS